MFGLDRKKTDENSDRTNERVRRVMNRGQTKSIPTSPNVEPIPKRVELTPQPEAEVISIATNPTPVKFVESPISSTVLGLLWSKLIRQNSSNCQKMKL